MSCGGTTFVWRTAPYGPKNMPAIYSRAMQNVCRGLQDHNLGCVLGPEGEALNVQKSWLGKGSLDSWLDDLTVATGEASRGLGARGRCEILRQVFERPIAAGMTLKPSKSHILRKELEVLEYVLPEKASDPTRRSLAQDACQAKRQKGSAEEIHSTTGTHCQSPVRHKDVREDKLPWGELENRYPYFTQMRIRKS
eukprot:6171937-Pleurochrysis_carterae.AAC.4